MVLILGKNANLYVILFVQWNTKRGHGLLDDYSLMGLAGGYGEIIGAIASEGLRVVCWGMEA